MLIALALYVVVAGRADPEASMGAWFLVLDPATRALAVIGVVATALLVVVAVTVMTISRRRPRS